MYNDSPKNKCTQIELFPREYTKDCIHVQSKLLPGVLTSHDERTHRDVGGIISFDILRSQIKVRVPVHKCLSEKELRHQSSDEPVVF